MCVLTNNIFFSSVDALECCGNSGLVQLLVKLVILCRHCTQIKLQGTMFVTLKWFKNDWNSSICVCVCVSYTTSSGNISYILSSLLAFSYPILLYIVISYFLLYNIILPFIHSCFILSLVLVGAEIKYECTVLMNPLFLCESVHTQVKQVFITKKIKINYNFLPTQLSLILTYFHYSYSASCGNIIIIPNYYYFFYLLSSWLDYFPLIIDYFLLYSYT